MTSDNTNNTNTNSSDDMIKKYEAMFILHSLGDTMGFKNGDWEFLKGRTITLDIVNELVYEFITLGGINGIDISGWYASDDTLYHISTAKSMLKYEGKLNKKFLLISKNEIIKNYNKMMEEIFGKTKGKKIHRNPGVNTTKYIQKYTEKTDAYHLPYDVTSGGNGCAMKMLCVGACLFGKSKREELINVSIRLGKLTHNSPIGFLGGLVTALFTAFAIEGIHIEKWPFEMLNILESKLVRKHISKKNSSDSFEEINDYSEFVKIWKKYLASRFKNKKLISNKSHTNLVLRVKYYHQILVYNTKAARIGESGYGAGIMAYDGLLDCTGNWEKLFFYTALQPGDSDTVCAIAGGLFGIYYGYSDTPTRLIEELEYGKRLKKISKQIFEKYWKKS